MPDAGWYDDPLVPGGKRYWDGRAWTESVDAPPTGLGGGLSDGDLPMTRPPMTSMTSPMGSSMGNAPPFEPLPAGAAATGHARTASGLADIGDWLNQTFRGLRDNALGVLLLFFVLPAVFFAVAYLAFHQSLTGVVWRRNDGFSNFDVGLAMVAGAGLLATLVASFIGIVAGHHLLYASHVDRPTRWPRSAAVGLQRLPRMLGVGLVVALGSLIAAAVPIGLFTTAAVSDRAGIAIFIALGVFATVAVGALLVWVWVKSGFVWVAVAVVPSGTSALGSSFRLSSGRFWPVFARLGIVTAMTTMLSVVIQTFAQFLAPLLLFSKFEVGPRGELLLDGQDVNFVDQVRFGDVMPNPVAALGYFTVYLLVTAAAQALIASGTSALYADAEAPNSFGHGGTADMSGSAL